MSRLRYLTAGESHGQALLVIIEGLPAGLPLSAAAVDADLARRRTGYGRGGRMKIEPDRVKILSGVRHGLTIGSPIGLMIENRDWENWRRVMDVEGPAGGGDGAFTTPRPGHADLAGGMKYGARDLRDILERASARETAARVAAGAVCRALLSQFGAGLLGWVEEIGGLRAEVPESIDGKIQAMIEASPFRCPDRAAQDRFKARVDEAEKGGDTVGGVFAVRAAGVVPGLGSHVHGDRRLDGRLAGAVMSIPGVKGVEIGLGFRGGHLTGTAFHDAILPRTDKDRPWRYRRATNRAGGLEGGMSNGEEILIRAMMKPIPTTARPLSTVDTASGLPAEAHRERADICAVPAASVIGEAMCAIVLADEYLEKFGGDCLEDTRAAFEYYKLRLSRY